MQSVLGGTTPGSAVRGNEQRRSMQTIVIEALTKIRLFGLGQPLADGLKFVFKEEMTPRHVDRFLYTLAPLSILVAALSVFAVIPFGSVLPERGDHQVDLVVAPGFDVGLIYIF